LKDEPFRAEARFKAYEYAKPMAWPRVGRRYLKLYGRVKRAVEPHCKYAARKVITPFVGEGSAREPI